MELCRYTQIEQDGNGRLEFFCTQFSWRMDMDFLEKCRSCSKYECK